MFATAAEEDEAEAVNASVGEGAVGTTGLIPDMLNACCHGGRGALPVGTRCVLLS